MHFGKPDGNHVSIGFSFTGINVFVPETKWTYAAGLGFSLRTADGDWSPHFAAFRCAPVPKLFAYMRHFRWPYNVIRVGSL